ncbi:MAG: biosynthetic-type acetolactate synthase large subunit [Promethearchaeota archaeon]
MPKMQVAEVVVKILEDEGVSVMFGIPGAAINPVYKYLGKSTKIKHIIARHEEGACHAADGYARVTGKVGVCICTSGPAATNFVTGLYTAQVDSIPIVAITGTAVRAVLGQEAFQAVDIAEIVKPVTKKSYLVKEPYRLPGIMREAFRIAREGRPGPVLIDLPVDLQRAEIEYDPETDRRLDFSTPKANEKQIKKAIDMILEAKNPIILAGGGVLISGAAKELQELAEYLSLPICASYMGKSAIDNNHPLYAGQVGTIVQTRLGNKLFLESDLVLAVGARFVDRHTGNLEVYTKNRKFIHIDIDPLQIGKIVPTELGIVSDAKISLQMMINEAKARNAKVTPNEWVSSIPARRKELTRRLDFDDVPIKPQRLFKEINEFFDDETVFMTSVGLNQIWSGQYQEIKKPGHYKVCGCAGTLGWDLPASIGAKVGYEEMGMPEKKVVGITGDGGLGFMVEELAMAAHYQTPIVMLVLNNGFLSLIRQNQSIVYEYEYAVDLTYDTDKLVKHGIGIDFVKLAEAFGIYGERVEKPDDLKAAFQRALDNAPSVLDIICERETNCSMGVALDSIAERG